MNSSFSLLFLGLAALTIFRLIFYMNIWIRNASLSRQFGCQPAPVYPNCGFLGRNIMRELEAADARQQLPDFAVEREHKMSALLGRECSTHKISIFGQTVFNTNDPKNVQAVLSTQFADYDVGLTRNAILTQTLGDGIFTQDGKKWEHSRGMLRPSFVRDQVFDLDTKERHVQNLLTVLPVQDNGWTAFTSIKPLLFRLTIDVATEFLFGESVNSQLAEAATASTSHQASETRNESLFSRNFDQAQMHMAKKYRLGIFHWLHSPGDYRRNNKVIDDFTKHYVDLALRRGCNGGGRAALKENESGKPKYIFLDALAQQTRDPSELRAQLLNILLAGRDTTASLLCWLFHQLLRNPEVFAKLRETVLETFGTYSDPHDISFATLKGCQYLQHTLSETLRLWPVVPFNSREANKATILPRGGGSDGSAPVFVPAGARVDYSIHVMQRNRGVWGEDADSFRPERFVGRRPGWDFLPFNGGPRICIGQQFALVEAAYVVVRLLQRFDAIEAAPGSLDKPTKSDLAFTSRPADPVSLRLRQAVHDS